MKYLKTYESTIEDEPQIGDYVICYEPSATDPDIINFLKNNIGQIVDIRNHDNSNLNSDYNIVSHVFNIFVQFRIPVERENYFNFHKTIPNCRLFTTDEIIFHSKNIEECKIYIDSEKYNL